ncbi:substrate-binding domain-containing protein [Streptomyces sp. RFCAC02]|uniref:LacI family DNA-binding transcriptional regulator n=1 Tax=Streptomyces sp. RFCAC02 TaxID=2499143 RepID=UPI0010200E6F|nr:substrate-binding domain-containing protein [Streptomyces sp. RFCAC02]
MSGSGAVGLVLARPARLLGVEPFFMEFIAGIEETLAARGMSVLLHVVPSHDAEITAYERWARRGLVDAVVVVNLAAEDRRPGVLRSLGLKSLVVGTWAADPDTPAVPSDDVGPVREAFGHLVELGHRHIARVTGPGDLLHTRARTRAMVACCREAGIEPVMLEGDYTAESGAELTAQLLRRAVRPTAITYDNDVMAVAGLGVAKELGVAVPRDLSLVAWDDSAMCQLATPALSVMRGDIHQFGVTVAESVLELVDDLPVTSRWSPAVRFLPRGSTAPAPVARAT